MGVEEVSSGKQIENGEGKVFVVDPNPVNNEIIPPEDMFIYVKFSAYPRNRVTYNGNGFVTRGVEDEVNFISTKIRYDGDGNLNPKEQNTYATTDWTNIGGIKGDTKSAGVLEGFGIKSINIKYNASLVPVVDITFTDVRGSGLFDVLGDKDILSPYSIFFKMPYPVFKLSVKGYFGQKVEFCLHMTNWTSQFDGSTGNFDISANFLGFQQAFLNDMVIGNIIGVINTSEGYAKLNEIYDRTNTSIGLSSSGEGKSLEEIKSSGKLNIRKLDDFFIKISKLQVESETLKTELDSFKNLKFLNGKYKILKEIQTFLGKPIPKKSDSQSNTDGSSKNYLEIKNGDLIDTDNINDKNLTIRENYLSIRDFLLINAVNINSFKSFIITLNDIVNKYNEYINGSENQKYKNTDGISKLSEKQSVSNKIKGNISKVKNYLKTGNSFNSENQKSTTEDNNFISLFNREPGDDSWKEYIIPSQKNPTTGEFITDNKFSLSTILEDMYTETSSKGIYLKSNYDNNNYDVNSEFNIEDFKLIVERNGFYNQNLNPNTVVFVVDLRKYRSLLENEIIELEKIIKIQQEIVQIELNEELFNKSKNNEETFKPTIKNCFEVLANNTQAMVETIYEITKSAESEGISGQRKNILKNYSTDIPPSILEKSDTNNKGIAWPSLYEKNGDGSEREVYIGSIAKRNRVIFPEYDFVERVFDNFISKQEELQNITKASISNGGLDTDNWYPFNPIDYKENPFLKFRFLNTEEEFKENFVKEMITRISLLKNYSLFDTSTGGDYNDYSFFDAINAYETLKINNNSVLLLSNIINIIKNDSKKLSSTSLIGKTNFFKENIEESSTPIPEFYLRETNDFPSISNFKFGLDYTDESNQYILYGKDYSEIINNSKKLWTTIKQSNNYTKITDQNSGSKINREENSGSKFYKTNYDITNNLYSNLIFNVWDDNVCKNIFNSNGKKINDNINNTKINDIDITGNTNQSSNKFFNLTYFEKTTSPIKFEEYFTNGNFYNNQNIYGRGYLLLSTIPFRNFKESFLDVLFPNNNYSGTRIINLPKYYIYYIGSLLWRYEETIDPINWGGDYSIFSTPKDEYPTKISYYKSIDEKNNKKLENELINLPKSVKKLLINTFKTWVIGNFNNNQNGKFESELQNYNSISPINLDSTKRYLLNELILTEKIILLNPNIFNGKVKSKEKLNISDEDIRIYIEEFSKLFSEKTNKNSNTQSTEKKSDEVGVNEENKNKIKLQIYNYFKNINDKWVSDTKKSFNVCGGNDEKNLIDYFKFIDRGWRDIGSEAVINLNSFLNLGNEQNTSVYMFMSKLLRDSSFLFQILPTYINYKNINEVAKIFKPQTVLETNDSSGPIYCCIYVGGASQVLDIKETNNYYFNNDGFAFKNGQLPPDIVDNNKANNLTEDFSLVAFRVAFGGQNQTIFKNVSLNQQEHKQTGEYFRALSELVDKRGATQKTYQGTDLLKLFKTRSYTCQVESLGCMNIQPMMYFDLQNVPFFNGAYLITSVSHNITPNHMTTSFQGLRQSKYISPPVTSITADVNIDLNASLIEGPIVNNNLTTNNTLYSIGVNNEIAEQDFDFNNITIENLQEIGVPKEITDIIGTNIQNYIIDPLKSNDIKTNSEVSMFFANVLANSDYFKNSYLNFSNGDYVNSELKFPTGSIYENQTIKYIVTNQSYDLNLDVNGVDKKYFTYQPVISASTNTVYDPTISYYFKGTDETLDESNIEITKNGNKLSTKLEPNNLKYYNIFKGDAFLYKPTGYLYVIGRKQYYDILEDGGEKPQKYNYEMDSEFIKFKTPFDIAIKVWKTIIDENEKNCSFYANGKNSNRKGTFTSFNQTRLLSQQYKGVGIEKSAKAFENVLKTFRYKNQPLVDYFNP